MKPRSSSPTTLDPALASLFKSLNLDPVTSMTGGRFSSFDAIWRHPTSQATLYVGGQAAAESLELLNKYGITRVVNCTEDLPNYHAKNRNNKGGYGGVGGPMKKTKKRSSSTDESKNATAYASSMAPASPSQPPLPLSPGKTPPPAKLPASASPTHPTTTTATTSSSSPSLSTPSPKPPTPPPPPVSYLRFPISTWSPPSTPQPQPATAFLTPLFSFVDSSLKSGHSVLLHCTAGTRKSGAAAVVLLARYAGLEGVQEAENVVRKCRHVVEVGGRLRGLVKAWGVERDAGGGGDVNI
mmetsp:Transcript_16742/g.33403  ORF Transcript_16742/g.33403 Transcript_16742/m.33403 type:complete len:297 (+) Transcript_16742:51-941(+)|eukprot:CAMPEP_0182487622 /NCGR_PEP_ID=MMETSP1319-20130603/47992_1 /TAXON_ID=172717 /ORGANISM="Bolidomonas pacifica, Strain RCC208" /LENGTH=296 /DNA_ID=CAMNT_0024689747 /DNA_START=2050 /DNA_END=2940 /DNA_ORIENTATION=-